MPAMYFPEAWGGTQTVEQVKEQFEQRLQRRYKHAAEFRLPASIVMDVKGDTGYLPSKPEKESASRNTTVSTTASLEYD